MGSIEKCSWEITNRCNLKCIHCITNSRKTSDIGVETEEALLIVKNLKELGCKEIFLTGGEPLMRPDIFKILEAISDSGIKASLLTNGTLINEEKAARLKNLITSIGVSLDGSTEEINDAIRGKSFSKIIESLKLMKSKNIPTTVYVTLNKINMNDIGGIIDLIKSLGINDINISSVVIRGRATLNTDKLKIKNGKLLDMKSYFDERTREEVNCFADFKVIFISTDGFVYPCTELSQVIHWKDYSKAVDLDRDVISRYQKALSKSKEKKCPYKNIVGDSFTYSFNTEEVCHLCVE